MGLFFFLGGAVGLQGAAPGPDVNAQQTPLRVGFEQAAFCEQLFEQPPPSLDARRSSRQAQAQLCGDILLLQALHVREV